MTLRALGWALVGRSGERVGGERGGEAVGGRVWVGVTSARCSRPGRSRRRPCTIG